MQWGTILLNNDLRMDFLSSSILFLTEGLTRFFRKNSKPLEDTVITSLQVEIEIKNTMQYSAGTICDLNYLGIKALKDIFIVEMKKKLLKDRSKTESKVYSICNDVLVYSERVVVPLSL